MSFLASKERELFSSIRHRIYNNILVLSYSIIIIILGIVHLFVKKSNEDDFNLWYPIILIVFGVLFPMLYLFIRSIFMDDVIENLTRYETFRQACIDYESFPSRDAAIDVYGKWHESFCEWELLIKYVPNDALK